MLEIPLDFIQSCSILRELRLSNMAMKKVPQSVRRSTTLHRLDLSSNRLADLEDAYLEQISGLLALYLQNNRIEKLPFHFPRLRSLTTLNLSNNKFQTLPILVTQLKNLRDLDISFNMISDIPGEIGQLQNLERLIIVGNQVVKFPRELADLKHLHSLDCRRNQISDLTIVCALPQLNQLSADHNSIHGLDLALGIHLTTLHVSHNDITQVSLIPVGPGMAYLLTTLDFSYAKLSSLEDVALGCLSTLRTLNLAHNSFRSLPDTTSGCHFLSYNRGNCHKSCVYKSTLFMRYRCGDFH
jgi:adenylate cyclase